MELKCGHRYYKQCLEVFFMREIICSFCELELKLSDVL
jgi:hypothetical protein